MTVSFYDLADRSNSVQLCGGHYRRLTERGVLMAAGVFIVGERHYLSDRHAHHSSVHEIDASSAEARACGMAMRTYADAVRDAVALRRDWVDHDDTGLLARADELIEFFATCNGFETH